MKKTPCNGRLDELLSRLVGRNERALGQIISLIERQDPEIKQALLKISPIDRNTLVIGITGAPGAGKSTLVDQLVLSLHNKQKRVAVIAVDPSSPFSGGALLGDRIRMSRAANCPGVFIRSMASRGHLGGLAEGTPLAIMAAEAAGYDCVIIETVGVGQSEVEIVKHADLVLVVIVPGMGDEVQTLKAGVLEIADIYVINKADYDGADRLEQELMVIIDGRTPTGESPVILRTVAVSGQGIEQLAGTILERCVTRTSTSTA